MTGPLVLNTDQVGAFVIKPTRMIEVVQATGAIVGNPRMQRFIADCGGDSLRAQALYRWNIAMAGATHEAVHLFEIILRNSMDQQLRHWNAGEGAGEDWLLTPHPLLNKLLRPDTLAQARSRARTIARINGRKPTHDDVLAQMSLGTWRYLLPSNSSEAKQALWRDALHYAFSNWDAAWESIVSRVELAHSLRNRVAHLEPLHRSNLRGARRAMREVTMATGREQGRLFVQSERMLPLIEELNDIVV